MGIAGAALGIIGILGILASIVMFSLALVRRSGRGIVRSLALGAVALILAIIGTTILEDIGKPAPITTPAETPKPPAPTTVMTLDIGWASSENWDADPEVDGIEVNLRPEDSEGKLVDTPGVVNVKLWLKEWQLPQGKFVKGDLVQEWSDIQVKKGDFDWMGANIRLGYKDFDLEQSERAGIIEVTFKTPDGKSFTARNNYVMLGE